MNENQGSNIIYFWQIQRAFHKGGMVNDKQEDFQL